MTLNGSTAPKYLLNLVSTLLAIKIPSFKGKKNVKKSTTIKYGKRAFSPVALKIWNSLPQHLRDTSTEQTFEKLIKMCLFHHLHELNVKS